ncbi:hypothetical protein [Streptomyces sp. NPDC059262]|uniref:hypothetical protein n=1 Tax=Streptomyces sp. NPDC059262 TaxID=3346797 RepID=UPI00369ADCDA
MDKGKRITGAARDQFAAEMKTAYLSPAVCIERDPTDLPPADLKCLAVRNEVLEVVKVAAGQEVSPHTLLAGCRHRTTACP